MINEEIRDKEVRLIDENGDQLGVVTNAVAQAKAEEKGLDLVKIAANAVPPVCKIMDYNKFRYEKKKKSKESAKKQRENMVDIKEFRLSVTIDKHDFDTRVRNARKNLEKGAKIKASIRFKGRQIAHPELARDVLNRFRDELADISDIEIQPKMEGRNIFMQLTPKK